MQYEVLTSLFAKENKETGVKIKGRDGEISVQWDRKERKEYDDKGEK